MRADGYMYAEFTDGRLATGFKIAPETTWNDNAKLTATKLNDLG